MKISFLEICISKSINYFKITLNLKPIFDKIIKKITDSIIIKFTDGAKLIMAAKFTKEVNWP